MRQLVLLFFLLLFFLQSAFGQMTAPNTAPFDAAAAGEPNNSLSAYSPRGIFTYTVEGGFCLAPRIAIPPDSLISQEWSAELMLVLNASTKEYLVRITGRALEGAGTRLTYLDTLSFQQVVNGFWFPDRDRLLSNGRPMADLVPRDSIFSIAPTFKTHGGGERVLLRVDHWRRVQGNARGAIAVFDAASVDSATVVYKDTTTARDTVYTTSIPGWAKRPTFFVKTDSTHYLELSCQVKYSGGDWAGTAGNTYFPIVDSTLYTSGVTYAIPLGDSLALGDSLRLRLRGRGPTDTGRLLLNTVKALWSR